MPTHVKSLYLFAFFLALCVTTLGALTRLTDSGLGCPDWPGCYGHYLAPTTHAALNHAKAHVASIEPVSVFNAWMEMVHRYAAGMLSLTLLGLLLQQWRKKTLVKPYPLYGACLLIVGQATLGMLTVTMTLRPWVVTSHLMGGLSILSLLWLAYLQARKQTTTDMKNIGLWPYNLAITLTFGQIFLGAWTATHYATLSCTTLPFCTQDMYQTLWQAWQDFTPTSQADFANLSLPIKAAIQQWHRLGAFVTALALFSLAGFELLKTNNTPRIQKAALLLLLLIILQMALGMSIILFAKPLWLAWAHHFVASIILLTLLTLRQLNKQTP